jgi:5-methylcytosine-specific restriction protein A
MPQLPSQLRRFGGRQSARGRGYTHAWEQARKVWLDEQFAAIAGNLNLVASLPNCRPPCRECMIRGVVTEATDVDHIRPHRGNQRMFWDRNNWQALCGNCHKAKTGRGE